MLQFDFDIIVIGGGSAGVRAARRLAEAGRKVAIVEKQYWGGTCVNVGCIPKKLNFYASQCREYFSIAQQFGYQCNYEFDWQELVGNNQKTIKRLNGLYLNNLQKLDITIFEAEAQIVEPHTITINQKTYYTKDIILATGSRPTIPATCNHPLIITSDDVFSLKNLPKSIVIYGSGYIALELASMLNSFGSEVILIYRSNTMLRSFDQTLVQNLQQMLEQRGIMFVPNTEIIAIEAANIGSMVSLNNGDKLNCHQLIIATGREANIGNTVASHCNLARSANGSCIVDQNYQTNLANLYAIGDVNGLSGLTPVAIKQAEALVKFLLSDRKQNITAIDEKRIPTAVFTLPELAQVGANEQQLKQEGQKYTIKSTSFKPLFSNVATQPTYMRLIVDGSDIVIGMSMLGPNAADHIQLLTLLLNQNISYQQLSDHIPLHPSNAEEWFFLK